MNYSHVFKCNKHSVYIQVKCLQLKNQNFLKISTCQYIDRTPPSKITNSRSLVVAIRQSVNIRIAVYN